MTRPTRPLTLAAIACLGVGGALSACGSDAPANSGSGTGQNSSAAGAGSGDKIGVVASFYPLEYAVQRVGGDHVQVTDLTKPGAEPHDLELTPQDVATVSQAKLAVYEKGLQPSLDKAVADQGLSQALDVSQAADLSLKFDPAIDEAPAPAKETASPAPATSGGEEEHEHENEAGTTDPHFWQDPVRYSKVVEAVAAKLGEIDPGHKADYDANAKAMVGDLTTLDGEYKKSLSTCTNKNLVTSHAAFGYLADRYGMKQVSISGIEPDAEPDPSRLAKISQFVKANKVSTIYAETLVSPAIAQTVASETGAKMATLDPIEGINDKSAGKNYLEVMRSNLAALKKGQGCS